MLEFTAVYRRVAEGYVAYVEELPGANTQGDTLDEARENLKEAVELVLESNRALAREDAGNDDLIREPLRLATGWSAANSYVTFKRTVASFSAKVVGIRSS
jgi:predicted RNase H-like HicB family nuclease